MRFDISEESLGSLAEYASVPIAFEVGVILDISDLPNDPVEFELIERILDVSYLKNYDSIYEESPARWPSRFDMTNWGLFAARVEGRRLGGAIVAFDSPGLLMLEGRRDLAVLWDIRVSPEARGEGVGFALFRAVEAWARARGCNQLKIETQNINVPACRFYARQGCRLAEVNRFAYPELPNETQLLWYKDLTGGE